MYVSRVARMCTLRVRAIIGYAPCLGHKLTSKSIYRYIHVVSSSFFPMWVYLCFYFLTSDLARFVDLIAIVTFHLLGEVRDAL